MLNPPAIAILPSIKTISLSLLHNSSTDISPVIICLRAGLRMTNAVVLSEIRPLSSTHYLLSRIWPTRGRTVQRGSPFNEITMMITNNKEFHAEYSFNNIK